MKRLKLLTLLLAFATTLVQVRAQATFPVNDIANPKNGCYAFINAVIVKDAQLTLQNGTLIIREGKIENTGTNINIPKDAVVVDCKGKYIYPSFIDLFSDYGILIPQRQVSGGFTFVQQITSNTKGAYGWNQSIKSETDGSKIFTGDDTKAKLLREIGFGAVLTHQKDGIARGSGPFVSLSTQQDNLLMLKEKAAAFYSFDK